MGSELIFWDVDTQADFLRPGGKLYVPGAAKIVPNLKRLTEWTAGSDVLVIASACAHVEGDEEFQMFPPHCLVGTPGQQKIPETTLPDQWVVPNRRDAAIPDLARYSQVVIEKQKFDVFSNRNTEVLLRRLPEKPEIVLYGVVTEICVAAAARGLLERGYRVRVVRDAVQHLDEFQAHAFLREVQRRGGAVVTTDQLLAWAGAARAAGRELAARKKSTRNLPRASKG